jgi:hypothetical protein
MARDAGVTIDISARKYVVGTLRAMVRSGEAKNFEAALDIYEERQAGDRQVSVHGESETARAVRRINAFNGASYTRIVGGVRTDVSGASEDRVKPAHRRNMGKVLGTLYVEYDASVASSAPDVVLELEGREAIELRIDDAIRAYINDYVSRLSNTARANIRIIRSMEASAQEIMRGKTPETYRAMKAIKYLHHNFPARDSISAREMIDLLRKYAA